MPRYNEFLYNSGALYGDASKLVYSAEPMIATALDYSSVEVSYLPPSGGTSSYVGFRIIRNQDGYPETEEDGVKIFEVLGINVTPDGIPITDSPDLWIPTSGLANGATAPVLQEGQFAYYKAWILKTPTDDWVPAGQCYTLIPKRHSLVIGGAGVKSALLGSSIVDQDIPLDIASTTHSRLMSYLPQVFTSISNSPLDEINSVGFSKDEPTGAEGNTLLSTFLSAFSFTVDEMMTLAANSLPSISGQITSPALLSVQSEQFNIAQDSLEITKTQKRLVRDAIRSYSQKGTLKGFKSFVENTTNYSAVITESRNKILGHENSTFDALKPTWDLGYDIYGYNVVDWQANTSSGGVATATIGIDESQTIPTVASAIDKNYCARITTTAANAAISYGSSSPALNGIPIVEGVQYTFAFQIKRQTSPSIAGTVTAAVTWYDAKEQVILTASGDAPSSNTATVTTSFTRFDFAWLAPTGAHYASIQLTFSSAQVYYLDMVMFNEAIYSNITNAFGTGTVVTYQGENSYVVGDVITVRGVLPVAYNLSNVTITGISFNSRGQQTGFTVANSAKGNYLSGGVSSKVETTPEYTEARSVKIFLNPTNTNYMVNPSFEGSGAGWTTSNCTAASISTGSGVAYSGPIGARTGAYKLLVTPTGSSAINLYTSVGSSTAGNILPQGVNYTFSVYVRCSTGTKSSPVVLTDGLKITQSAKTGSTVVQTTTATKTLSLTTDWQRVSVTIWAPDVSDYTNIQVSLTGILTGMFIEVDAAQLEVGVTPTDYFDGSMVSTGCAWILGSANSTTSWSVKYLNQSYRLNRLLTTINEFLPINTPWMIDYYDNAVSSNLYSGIS